MLIFILFPLHEIRQQTYESTVLSVFVISLLKLRILLTGFHKKFGITGLHPRSPRHLSSQPSARISQTLRPSYLTYMIAAAT
jgi:hypothetical protein